VRKFLPIIAACLLGGTSLPVTANIELARALNDAFASVYEKVSPSVVVIEVSRDDQADTIFPDGWEFFFRQQPGSPRPQSPAQGSGIILSNDGYIVTNFHVIATAAPDGIEVTLKDGRKLPATIVGVDDKTDLAVLQVEADDLPAAELGDSDAVRVGQFAFALGAPMELPYTFTFGLVSATGRSNLTRTTAYEDYIQTDAAINPGNSGGPLVDIDGRVVGINTLISGLSRGLGFAIPINMVKEISKSLISSGEVIRPWLGISIEGIEESERLRNMFRTLEKGVVVQSIIVDTPASRSDLRAGDVITHVDDQPVARAGEVQRAVLRRAVGDMIKLDVWRQGQTRTVQIAAGRQPGSWATAGRSPRLLPSDEDTSSTPSVPVPPEPALWTLQSLGLDVEEITPRVRQSLSLPQDWNGLVINQVLEGSAAEASGLQVGDVITEANGKPVRDLTQFTQTLSEIDPDRGLMLSLLREGRQTFGILKP
jgi:serine protease Do